VISRPNAQVGEASRQATCLASAEFSASRLGCDNTQPRGAAICGSLLGETMTARSFSALSIAAY